MKTLYTLVAISSGLTPAARLSFIDVYKRQTMDHALKHENTLTEVRIKCYFEKLNTGDIYSTAQRNFHCITEQISITYHHIIIVTIFWLFKEFHFFVQLKDLEKLRLKSLVMQSLTKFVSCVEFLYLIQLIGQWNMLSLIHI